MEIRETRQGDVLVLAPDTNITASEDTNALDSKLTGALKGGTKLVVVDCVAVSQLSSAAVRVLLTVSRRLDRTGGRLVLCGMNAKLRKAFTISGVDKDFVVAATRDEGLQRVLEPVPVVVRIPPPDPRPAAVAPGAPVPPVAIEPATPIAPIVEGAAAAPVEPPPPAIDPREALATALLNALGIKGGTGVIDRATRDPRQDLEPLAAGLLTALSARVS